MEGLIPMVYKALKKKTTRRQYKCLSSGAAQTYNNNISVDFYAQQGYKSYQLEMASSIGGGGGDVELMASSNGRQHHHHHHHRRHKSSIGDYSTGFSAVPEDTDTDTDMDTVVLHNKQPKPKLVRFRSHRFFSCVTPNSA